MGLNIAILGITQVLVLMNEAISTTEKQYDRNIQVRKVPKLCISTHICVEGWDFEAHLAGKYHQWIGLLQ